MYNSDFQMMSLGASREVCHGDFMQTFKIQGQVYHLAGSFLPSPGAESQLVEIIRLGDQQEEAYQVKAHLLVKSNYNYCYYNYSKYPKYDIHIKT
jgi:hypothetical protein